MKLEEESYEEEDDNVYCFTLVKLLFSLDWLSGQVLIDQTGSHCGGGGDHILEI